MLTLYNRREPTLASHLWILSQLLFSNRFDSEGDKGQSFDEEGQSFDEEGQSLDEEGQSFDEAYKRLMKYTIATCHPKMIRRFDNGLSACYMESLRGVKDLLVKPEVQSDIDAHKVVHDRALLEEFVKYTDEIPDMLQTSIPKIKLICGQLPPKGKPFQLYTSETCMEFHNLLLELLDSFQLSLRKLKPFRGKPVHDPDLFRKLLRKILVYGFALLSIARGNAIEMHLQSIEGLLADHRRANVKPSPMPEEEDMEKDGTMAEEELEVVQPLLSDTGLPMPLWKTYRDWLRLMVVHFDAVNILMRFVAHKSPSQTAISVKILVAPTVDNGLLSWSDLLNDPKLFPVGNTTSSGPTNQDLLDFLMTALAKIKTARKYASSGLAAQKYWNERNLKNKSKQIIQQLHSLKNLSDYVGSVDDICELVTKRNADEAAGKPEDSAVVDDITNKIQSLCDTLDKECERVRFPFNLEMTKFLGTLHCEACLTSILHNDTRDNMTDDRYKEVLDKTVVGCRFSNFFWLS